MKMSFFENSFSKIIIKLYKIPITYLKHTFKVKMDKLKLHEGMQHVNYNGYVSQFLYCHAVLDELVVETQRQQRERLEQRLSRRRALVAEREAAGLPADDNTIEGILDEQDEEERRVRRRVGVIPVTFLV